MPAKFKSSCIDDLERFAEISLNEKNLSKLCHRLISLWDHVQQAKREEDYERVYICFRRWLRIVDWIRELPDYEEEKSYFDSYFGNDKYSIAVVEMREVLKILQEHYRRLETDNKEKLLIEPEIKVEKKPLPRVHRDISCNQMHKMFKSGKQVLIIDVRSEEEYMNSKICVFDTSVVHIPAEAIRPGVPYSYYEKYLKNEELEIYKEFKNADIVVVMDQCTTLSSLKLNSPLEIIKNTLEEENPTIMQRKLAILRGGFQKWANTFPRFTIDSTENDSVRPKSVYVAPIHR